jgi:transcriptional regulator with XRE-family HTH domain
MPIYHLLVCCQEKYNEWKEVITTGTTLGERLKEARIAIGMTQEALARLAGTTEVSVYRYETGQRVPSAGVLNRLVGHLKCNAAWLVTGNGAIDGDPTNCLCGQWKKEEKELCQTLVAMLRSGDMAGEAIKATIEAMKATALQTKEMQSQKNEIELLKQRLNFMDKTKSDFCADTVVRKGGGIGSLKAAKT